MKRYFCLKEAEDRRAIILPNTKRRVLAAIVSVTFLTLFIGLHFTVYYERPQISAIIIEPQFSTEGQRLPQVVSEISQVNYSKSASARQSSGPSLANFSINKEPHFPKTHRRLPQALIVGVRKCGTRALLEMLFMHPRIQKAAGEVHFFDRDENYSKGLEWYRKKMPYSFENQVTIEKSPSYFVTPEVPERIYAMNSSIKLLLILREPVTRAISDYTQLRSHNGGTTSSAVRQQMSQHQKSFEELVLRPDGRINENYRPIATSVYHTFIHQWLDVFGRIQILIVNGDRLIEDPVSEVQKIESFLNLESRIDRQNFYFNQTKGFYCMRDKYSERCLRDSKGRKHPRVDPVVIGKLRKYFNDHNQKLYELIGQDMGWPDN